MGSILIKDNYALCAVTKFLSFNQYSIATILNNLK